MQFFLLAITDALPGKNLKLRSDNIFFSMKKWHLFLKKLPKFLHNLYRDSTSIMFKIYRNLTLLSIWKSILFGWNPYLTNWKIQHTSAFWKKMQFFLLAITDASPGKKSEIKQRKYFFSKKKLHLFLKKLPKFCTIYMEIPLRLYSK